MGGGGGGGGSFFVVILKNLDVLAGPVVSLAYPLYASIRAIETKSPVDDQQWLTYWVLYSFLTLFELTMAPILEWLPFWSYAKLILNCWLVLPYFNGAAYVYQQFVRPAVVNKQFMNVLYPTRTRENLNNPEELMSAAERYIQQNGAEAFEKLINRSVTTRRVTSDKPWSERSIYEEDHRY